MSEENFDVILSVEQLEMFSRISSLLGKGWNLRMRVVDIPEGYGFVWRKGGRSVLWRDHWGGVVELVDGKGMMPKEVRVDDLLFVGDTMIVGEGVGV
tara:strand:+ start:283 stop:573 length:291 start_codon:yes stop_codon:yes gene_type:complete